MPDAASLIGREIGGRYQIVSQIAEGGMATAYLANDRRVSRQVVVKIPHAELIRQADFRTRFQREVKSLTELQHPGVIPLYDCGEEPGLPYCVVRYLPGGDLADRLEAAGGRLSVAEIIRWLPHVAETLDFVHRAGVIHRDVTPVNILFDDNGNAFLSDFGVAAISGAADATQTSALDARLTAEGAFVGAAIYAPPEAVQRNLTPAYDQYSLALVLYHCLCGYLPFAQLEPRALMVAKNSEAPAPLDARGVPISSAAVKAVMRGLSIRPEDRFPSCSEFADAFAGIGVDTEAIMLPDMRPARESRWPRITAIGAGLLAIGVAAFWMSTRVSDAPSAPPVLSGTAQIGSTEAELAGALALCAAHGGPCNRDLYDDETLQEVSLGPYALDPMEVTNLEFAAFADATGYETTAEQNGRSRDGPFAEPGLDWRHPAGPRSSHLDLPDHPVVHVSTADAEAYCANMGGRLPTEAEWEFAARGEDRRVFPWGPTWSAENANWASGGAARLRAVGSSPPVSAGPFGHHDLSGNVWEWTATHSRSRRVLRGGSWMETNPANLRAAVRLLASPADSSSDIGFRCARDVEK